MAIAFDATIEAHDGGSSNSHTVSFTVGSGSNRLLMVAAYSGTNGTTVSGITYNGVAMTYINRAKYASNNSWVYVYYLIAPASGTHDIVVSYSQNCYHGLVAVAYTGVDQTSPINASGITEQSNASTISKAVTSTVAGCWGYGAMEMSNVDYSLTLLANDLVLGVKRGGAGDYALAADTNASIGGAGTYTIGFSHTNAVLNGLVAVMIAPVQGTAYTQSNTESVTAVEVVARLAGKPFVEVATMVDTVARTATKAIVETAAVVEVVARTAGKATADAIEAIDTMIMDTGKLASEAITTTDTVLRSMARSIAETIEAVEVVGTLRVLVLPTITEVVDIADTMARAAGKLATDTITAAETVARTLAKSIVDVAEAVETVASIKTYERAIQETITAVDTIYNLTSKAIADTITAAETVAKQLTAALAIVETIVLVETVAKVRTAFANIVESITTVETVARVFVFGKQVVETIALTDRIRGLLNGVNMLYNNKYADKAVTYFKKYLDPK